MEETREALVQKLLDIYSKEGNYETSVPGVWVHRSERNKVPKPHIYHHRLINMRFRNLVTFRAMNPNARDRSFIVTFFRVDVQKFLNQRLSSFFHFIAPIRLTNLMRLFFQRNSHWGNRTFGGKMRVVVLVQTLLCQPFLSNFKNFLVVQVRKQRMGIPLDADLR